MQRLRIGSTAVAIGIALLLGTTSLVQASGVKQSCPALNLKAQNSSPAHPKPKSKARGFFPKQGLAAGTCSIYCADGGETTTSAQDVHDCTCQCAAYCGGYCEGVDLDTGETASCLYT